MLVKSFGLLAYHATCMLMVAPFIHVGSDGTDRGKHIVFIVKNDEYRSKEFCPYWPIFSKVLWLSLHCVVWGEDQGRGCQSSWHGSAQERLFSRLLDTFHDVQADL